MNGRTSNTLGHNCLLRIVDQRLPIPCSGTGLLPAFAAASFFASLRVF